MMRSIWRPVAVRDIFALPLVLVACVFPSDTPTGIEFSWQFVEVEASDGEDGQRVVTCSATGVETIAVSLQDLEDAARRGTFRFACETGFQTASELARGASEAFLELRPHEYDVILQTEVPGASPERLATRTIDVLARAVTLELWEFKLAPVAWTLQLSNAATCDEFSLAMFYADPEGALAQDIAIDEDGDPVDVLYRKKLVSDRGLGVAGTGGSCAGQQGEHRFVGLDRGTYRLEVVVDGNPCAIEVDLGASGTTSIDLGALPCGD
jgi:hypothetical protein